MQGQNQGIGAGGGGGRGGRGGEGRGGGGGGGGVGQGGPDLKKINVKLPPLIKMSGRRVNKPAMATYTALSDRLRASQWLGRGRNRYK